MQWVLLIAVVILSLGLTLGSASVLLSLLFRIMQKLR